MNAYYSEIDAHAAAWLRNLISGGHIAPGDVDERSITDVRPADVAGYTQCHWFAGIGGWSLALRLAGWPDDRPIWSGSCPCQPFSAAGKGKASGDERHLWGEWARLVRAVRPPVIFGEQVEAAIGWGWLDLVHSDLEAEGYTIRSSVLPACSVGAPHIRSRLWFVADRLLDHPTIQGLQERSSEAVSGEETRSIAQRSSDANPWCESSAIWLPCTDGKQRPTQPGIFPLAHGISGRVAKLRAAGNAIVPQVAAEFIKAVME